MAHEGCEDPALPLTYTFPVWSDVRLTLEIPAHWQALDRADTFHTLLLACEHVAGCLATLVAKDAMYGGAWREQGWRGNVARILSKTARLKNMLWRSDPVDESAEPVADTLQDLINLCLFTLLNRQAGNEWGR